MTVTLRYMLLYSSAWRVSLLSKHLVSPGLPHHRTSTHAHALLPHLLYNHQQISGCKLVEKMSSSQVSENVLAMPCTVLLTVLEMYAPIKGRVVGGGMASSGNGPHLSGLAVRFQTNSPFETLAAAPNTGSDGSDSTASLSSSGGSLSQLGPNQATGGSTTSSRGQVDSQQPQATQLVSPAYTKVT